MSLMINPEDIKRSSERLNIPVNVKCKVCMIKGRMNECPRCWGTSRKPIPNAEVMHGGRKGQRAWMRSQSRS